MKKQNREHGTTVILTTHDMQDIAALAERVILIGRGRILLDGTLDDIRREGGSSDLEQAAAGLYRRLDIL